MNSYKLISALFYALQVTSLAFPQDTQPASNLLLDFHNKFRALHVSTQPLTWDAGLAQQAQDYASQCQWAHSGTSGVGENLYVSTDGSNIEEAAVSAWYIEISQYDYAQPDFSAATGHFTQAVWKDTTNVGCGVAVCDAGQMLGWEGQAHLVVCQYSPPGNVIGEFQSKVLPLN